MRPFFCYFALRPMDGPKLKHAPQQKGGHHGQAAGAHETGRSQQKALRMGWESRGWVVRRALRQRGAQDQWGTLGKAAQWGGLQRVSGQAEKDRRALNFDAREADGAFCLEALAFVVFWGGGLVLSLPAPPPDPGLAHCRALPQPQPDHPAATRLVSTGSEAAAPRLAPAVLCWEDIACWGLGSPAGKQNPNRPPTTAAKAANAIAIAKPPRQPPMQAGGSPIANAHSVQEPMVIVPVVVCTVDGLDASLPAEGSMGASGSGGGGAQ